MLRRIFESIVEEVTGGWRTFHNEELRNFCHSLHTAMVKIKKKYTRYITHMGETKDHNCRKPLRIGPLGTLGHKWEDNIKEIGWEDQWRFF